MKTLSAILLAMAVITGSSFAKDGSGSHGGDLIEIGGAKHVFDVLEYDKEFAPTELEEYTTLIAPKIAILKNKLPRVGRYMENIFTRGIQPRWYFVKYSLKEINDEGPTNLLILSYKKVQVAINSGRVIQIDEGLFKELPARERAYLLMHEAVISAIGVELVRDGSELRSLGAFFLHKNLGQFTTQEIGQEILGIVKEPESKLETLATMDTGGSGTLLGKSEYVDLSTLSDGKTPSSCLSASDHCVFQQLSTGLNWTRNFADEIGNKSWTEANGFCSKLTQWGGHSRWRLPTLREEQFFVAQNTKNIVDNFPHWGSVTGPLWSSSSYVTNPLHAWWFDIQFGVSGHQERLETQMAFRCVRSDLDDEWTDISLTANGATATTCNGFYDQCAFAHKTSGLVWSNINPGYRRNDIGGAYTYLEAKSACKQINGMNEGRGYAGRKDWHLPSSDEWVIGFRARYATYASRFSVDAVGDLAAELWSVTKEGETVASGGRVYPGPGPGIDVDYLDRRTFFPTTAVRGKLRDQDGHGQKTMNGTPADAFNKLPWVCVSR
ncbi:MAG: DUF1566 domain-containing protein [Deltaproteobacteria bacterium]|nr:DUF1566 domain-containing protein [Deltaproteobacteria bacterium]